MNRRSGGAPTSPDRGGDQAGAPNRTPARGIFGHAFRLGRILGIDIQVDWSLAIVFVLVAVSLGAGAFPQWHPDWSQGLVWTVAVAAAVLFFASVLLHEMSHALVGRVQGIVVRRITLFVFGGAAHMESEPPSPRAELLMAGAGPLTSIVIGVVASLAGAALAGPALAQQPMGAETLAALQDVGPFATVLLWLGPINVLLGIFNMVPGFPLDGGRVLRAVLWWTTGDMRRATRWASGVGQGIGLALIATGVAMALGVPIPVLGRGLLPGLWLVLIGWFLKSAAQMSYRQLVVEQALEGVPVQRVMRRDIQSVPPDITLDEFIHHYAIRSDQSVFPVVADDAVQGQLVLDHVRRLDRNNWSQPRVRDLMVPLDRQSTLTPDDDALEALRRFNDTGRDQLTVMRDSHLLGIVRQSDVVRWIMLHPGSAYDARARSS